MDSLHDAIFTVTADVRYVAVASGQHVQMRSRPHLTDASDSESDRYEELLVNPALITLARQRGDIDCGGLNHLVIGYGHFNQLVIPTAAGHVSVAFELDADPIPHIPAIQHIIAAHHSP